MTGTVAICSRCQEPIEVGCKYIRIGEQHICENCLDDMLNTEIIELLGGVILTASEDDVYDGYDG